MITKDVQFKIKVISPFDILPKVKCLEKLSNLDIDVLEKLVKLSTNSKAINTIKNNFSFLENFLK